MLRFDKSFNGFETVGTAYDFIALCCKRCKVELANKRAEIDAMPNGGVTLSVYTENDIETCRDVLFYVAQVLVNITVRQSRQSGVARATCPD